MKKEKDIKNTIDELISMTQNNSDMHFLAGNGALEDFISARKEISDLVKEVCRLPDVDSPEKMLLSKDNKRLENGQEADSDPYRMINLISGSFRLPDIDEDDFLR